MRVLITGGLGFIGSHVVEAAAEDGHQVRILDNRTLVQAAREPDCESLRSFADLADIVHADVADRDAVNGALSGVDAVIHLAAKVGLGKGISDAPEYVMQNDLGTAVLLAAMDKVGVGQLVLASSMVVYGEGLAECPQHGAVKPQPRRLSDLENGSFESTCPRCGWALIPMLIPESAPIAPTNAYAATKASQEHLASAWVRATEGSAVALRYHNVYGRRLPRDTPYAGVAALFVTMLQRGQAPRVFEDGGQRRDFVHVRDVARANIAALTARSCPEVSVFNIGSGTVRSVLDMATALSDSMSGATPVVTGEFRAGDVRHITASSSKAANVLNWSAEEDFVKGMAELCDLR